MANIKVGNTNITRMSVIEPYDDSTPSDKDEIKPWVRPSDWLDMPTFASGDNKVAILMFVPSGTDLQSRITLYGTYVSNNNYPTYSTIDWGDGTTVVHSGRSTSTSSSEYIGPAEHTYDYNNLSPDTEFYYNGHLCRQAMIEIDNSVSGMFSLNLGDLGGTYLKTDPNNYGRRSNSHNCLDVNIQSSNLTSLAVSEYPGYRGYPRNLKRIKIRTDESVGAHNLFWGCENLEVLDVGSGTFRNSTSFNYTFAGCKSLKTLPYFDMSSATSVSSMFDGCTSLRKIPDFNTTNVTSFSQFARDCWRLEEVPNCDYSSNTSFYRAFLQCYNLKSIPSGLVTSNVTSLNSAFTNCRNLVAIPQDFFDNAQNVTDVGALFSSCLRLKSIPKVNLPNCTVASSLFNTCRSLESVKIEDMSSCTTTNSMFNECSALRKVYIEDISKFSTQDTASMFRNCYSLAEAPYFDTSQSTSHYQMFYGCSSFEKAPSYDFSSSTRVDGMFLSCNTLKSVGAFKNLGDVDYIGGLFQYANLEEFPSGLLQSGSTKSLNGNSMFWSNNIEYLPDINISGMVFNYVNYSPFRSTKLKGFGNIEFGDSTCISLFRGCNSIIRLPSWDVSNVQSLSTAFECQSLVWSDLQGTSCDVGYAYCYMGSGALTNVINNLVSGVTGKTIDIRYNYGAKELHPDTIAIATAKGWTVTT